MKETPLLIPSSFDFARLVNPIIPKNSPSLIFNGSLKPSTLLNMLLYSSISELISLAISSTLAYLELLLKCTPTPEPMSFEAAIADSLALTSGSRICSENDTLLSP
ncbi:MAG: hypothetical protein LM589_03375 [Thermosphaera sp.]|nr:hypothetical protein [Thermosphaera sp.]